MSVTKLPNGQHEVSSTLDAAEPMRFRYDTFEGARELAHALHIYRVLRNPLRHDECANAEIHAAADIVLRAPCDGSAKQTEWLHEVARRIRSYSDEAQIDQRPS